MELAILILAIIGFVMAFVSWKVSHWSSFVSGIIGFLVFSLGTAFTTINPFTLYLFLGIAILSIGMYIVDKVRNRKLNNIGETNNG